MKSRTIAKVGIVLSVVLFCTAVVLYGFAKLSMVEKEKDFDLFSLVPAEECIGVLESDNINYFIDVFPQLNYSEELGGFRFPGLFNYVLFGLNEYTTNTAHGLSSQMSRMVVSFHAPGSPRDQVLYFCTGDGDEKTLAEMLRQRAPWDMPPKKEKYKGKSIRIYPLINGDFLSVYSESGFFAVSYKKSLIEQVIDTRENEETALSADPVFAKAVQKKKSNNFLTLYGLTLSLPFLQSEERCWSDFDFHMNSDVLYLTGETFMPDTCSCLPTVAEKLQKVPDVHEDNLVISANRDSMDVYMNETYKHDNSLFKECVANLSDHAAFMLVADMERVSEEPERFTSYLPHFLLENAPVFRPFILSAQLSLANDKLSHIMVLTYKD